MNTCANRNVSVAALVSVLIATVWPMTGCAAQGDELDLRPIEVNPEPLGPLHPKLRWMTEEKVRVIWISDDLFEKSVEGDRTKAQVIADAGFNIVIVEMNPNSDGSYSGVVDTSKPPKLEHDRSRSTDLETRLEPNVAEARRVGLPFFVGWKYGTNHLEPYRKYRSPTKGLAKYTCCPLDEAYVAGQHIGKWAVMMAEGGAVCLDKPGAKRLLRPPRPRLGPPLDIAHRGIKPTPLGFLGGTSLCCSKGSAV